MVKINKIYTRTGDDGTTGLVGGERIKKNSGRVSAYGDIDELNSQIGVARTAADTARLSGLAQDLQQLQQHLFDIGAELACPGGKPLPGMSTFPSAASTALEKIIDRCIDGLPELTSFVLPGGNDVNAALHVARAICRRAERTALAVAEHEYLSKPILIYLNRLSDCLFAMARRASFDLKSPEYLWTPGKT